MLGWESSVCSSHGPLVSRSVAGPFQGTIWGFHSQCYGFATRRSEALLLQEGSSCFSTCITIR